MRANSIKNSKLPHTHICHFLFVDPVVYHHTLAIEETYYNVNKSSTLYINGKGEYPIETLFLKHYIKLLIESFNTSENSNVAK